MRFIHFEHLGVLPAGRLCGYTAGKRRLRANAHTWSAPASTVSRVDLMLLAKADPRVSSRRRANLLLLRVAAVVHPASVLRSPLSLRPLFKHFPLHVVEHLDHLGGASVGGEFQAVTAGIKEIDGLENGVIGGADHRDAVGFEAGLGSQQGVHGIDFQGEVLSPFRGIGVATHGWLRGQLEEGKDAAIAGIEEDVHVGVWLLRGGNLVLGNGQDETHVQVLAVPLDSFFGVTTTVSNVMDFLDLHVYLRLMCIGSRQSGLCARFSYIGEHWMASFDSKPIYHNSRKGAPAPSCWPRLRSGTATLR